MIVRRCPFLPQGIALLFAAAVALTAGAQQPSETSLSVTSKRQPGAFPLVAAQKAVPLYVDAADAAVAKIAARAFREDVALVTGIRPALDSTAVVPVTGVIVGTIGQSRLVDQLVNNKKLEASGLKGAWERFGISVVENPFGRGGQALVVAGSDPRGTAFGLFELSKRMGVSPFYWWADAAPQHREEVYVAGKFMAPAPSVKFRGIFINDEDWGLQPWAEKTFEPETGDIGPKTYAKVFELLLRLKANLIWPAMHPSTKAFFHYPGNAQVAADYAIVVGSSHAEPMLRNNVGEWKEKTMGAFNYLTNKETVYKYWEDRVKESSGVNALYTIGMRGVHDGAMEGVKGPKEAIPLLERIIADQRGLLAQYMHQDATAVPQVFTAYKEVLDIYDNGLKVPEDVTLVWPDDNYGYIHRLNNNEEAARPGGSGVYYHASYWGRPHDYLWLGSTHPGLVREEMMKAYENGSNRVWVLNVGDIKPLEYNIEQFMDMAYNAAPFQDPAYTRQHLARWAAFLFGSQRAAQIGHILWEYYQLAFERRPEFMGWSQTEPTTKTAYSEFNHFFYGDEAQRRIDRYADLERQVRALRPQVAPKDQDAFYQLVYYPVVGASLMNKKFLYRDKSHFYALQQRSSAAGYAQKAQAAFDSIVKETDYFNNQLAGGKWKHMMSWKPRELPVYQAPVLPQEAPAGLPGWGVAPEGFVRPDSSLVGAAGTLELPAFDPLNRQQFFVDIFLHDRRPVAWTASVSDPRIRLSQTAGRLDGAGQQQVRLWVTVDWSKAPGKTPLDGKITFKGGGKQVPVRVTGRPLSLAPGYKGFIENNGYVALHAAHYSRQSNRASGPWKLLAGQGYTGEALEAGAVALKDTLQLGDTAWIKQHASFVEYDFYTFSPANAVATVFTLPTHPLHKAYSMRYAVSVDGGPLQVADFRTVGRSEEWKQNVLKNRATKQLPLSALGKGAHSLRVYSVDPGVVLQEIRVDLGGLKKAYSTLPETKPFSQKTSR
ncbi:glycosyl hydrolase 115 family protein [Paraflavisolibacter sp. H34]|uniref:glycosyl hydrolase 115 family protein n=1 Tax=Huijunlia imazamoxiresistens TaxID=3127457 RepID=UPI00301612C7